MGLENRIMFIGKVTGNVVASQKIDSVVGHKMVLVQALTVKGEKPGELAATGRVAVAIDTLGAGEGDIVLVTQGSSARLTDATKNLPTDAVVIGIIESIRSGGRSVHGRR
jgi:ethanolamine utilization protein EutN